MQEIKLQSISINDNISFKYNYQAMNACFNGAYKTYFDKATVSTSDGCEAWFPKAAKRDTGGRWKSGADRVNWKNQLINNGTQIIEWLYPNESVSTSKDEPPELPKHRAPLHCFMKDEDKEQDYKYCGTFFVDFNCSKPRQHLYRRIKTELDLSQWYNRKDMSYYDFDKDGYDVFKHFYIERNYKKQRALIEKFRLDSDDIEGQKECLYSESISLIKKFIAQAKTTTSALKIFKSLINDLNLLFGLNLDEDSLTPENEQDYMNGFVTILSNYTNAENNHNDIIRDSKLGQHLAGTIFATLNPDKYYLYALSEEETDYFLKKLGMTFDSTDDITEKHSLLYFWKQCNYSLDDFSLYAYHKFLEQVFESPFKKRKTIEPIHDKNTVLVNEYREFHDKVLIATKQPKNEVEEFTFKGVKVNKPEGITVSPSKAIPRMVQKKINAFAHAGYCCEIDKNHQSFISKATGKNYMEAHHLVPLENWDSFDVSLDVEENIVCLCSNCHNEIHYGENADLLIELLYDDRKDDLKKVGIDITLDELLSLYGFTSNHQ